MNQQLHRPFPIRPTQQICQNMTSPHPFVETPTNPGPPPRQPPRHGAVAQDVQQAVNSAFELTSDAVSASVAVKMSNSARQTVLQQCLGWWVVVGWVLYSIWFSKLFISTSTWGRLLLGWGLQKVNAKKQWVLVVVNFRGGWADQNCWMKVEIWTMKNSSFRSG